MVLVVAGGLCLAKQPESHYQRKWCEAQHGRTEVRLPDRTRVDCILDTHAVEVAVMQTSPLAVLDCGQGEVPYRIGDELRLAL